MHLLYPPGNQSLQAEATTCANMYELYDSQLYMVVYKGLMWVLSKCLNANLIFIILLVLPSQHYNNTNQRPRNLKPSWITLVFRSILITNCDVIFTLIKICEFSSWKHELKTIEGK